MAVLPVGFGASGGYTIDRSLRFRASASAYFNRTPASAGNRKTWTWSAWVKRGSLSTAYNQYLFSAVPSASVRDGIIFNTSSGLSVFANDGSSAWLATTQVFRDVSAWYHIVVAVDTTQATSSNRMKIYLNGSQITSFSTATYPSQNYDWGFDNSVRHTIGDDAANAPTGTYHFDGYLTEINFIDGQALTPSSFGENDAVTGVWKPKKYVGTYGTNGFYLNFSDNTSTTTLGYDYSGNGNNWTANNISLTSGVTYDSMLDVPTLTSETAANYCTLNPLAVVTNQTGTYSDGNLTYTSPSSTYGSCASTMAIPSSGKWYAEVTPTSAATYWWFIGLCEYSANGGPLYSNTNAVSYYSGNGNKYVDNVASSYGSSYTTNDVIGIAVDADSNTVTFYKNNVSQGSISHSVAGLFFSQGDASIGGSTSAAWNFGQRPFAYTPPTGFKALNTFNLPDSTVADGSDYFNTVLYTGTGSTQSITGVGFQPSLVWGKSRTSANSHSIYDAVRGTGLELFSDTTDAEVNRGTSSGVQSFDTDGFSVAGAGNLNTSGNSYVGWNWKANGSGVSNTDGSITSTVSANPTAGFSIVKFVNASSTNQETVGHGLGIVPKLIICKNLDTNVNNWAVFHASVCDTTSKFLKLNTTDGTATFSTVWGASLPTSSVFGVTGGGVAAASVNVIAYCFAEVEGFSKMGSYTGNGSADGPFVFCGFRPSFIFWKNASTTSDWQMKDSSRSTYNVTNANLYANLANAENSAGDVDFLSNGFKLRSAGTDVNGSGNTIIYVAFAENPFKNSLAR